MTTTRKILHLAPSDVTNETHPKFLHSCSSRGQYPLNSPLSDPVINNILQHLSTKKDFVFLESSKTTAEEKTSFLFTDPVDRLPFHANQNPEQFFARAQKYLDQGYFLAGWFGYEFGYALETAHSPLLTGLGDTPLAELGVYHKPITFDQSKPLPDGGWPLPFNNGQEYSPGPYHIDNITPSITKEEYLRAINRIKEYIAAGDTYQVNYTLKLLFNLTGSPESLYLSLRRNQQVSYSAYLHLGNERILSFSPELFFRKSGRHCMVRPMKGTMARGRTIDEDLQMAAALHSDPKNRSENVMIVDLLRNDLGRLSSMGGVEVNSLFTVETYATVHQLTSSIQGHIDDHVGLEELFKALFPCGSVTGAPKIRTMEIIHELEHARRGVYTGAIGYLSPQGDGVFNVPIRTVLLRKDQGEMGIGSGVVNDSDPVAEWQECLLKGRFLSHPRPDFQLIETILWQRESGFWLLDLHLNRLTRSAQYFDYPEDREAITQNLTQQSTSWSYDILRVRLLLHRDGKISIEHTPCPAPAALSIPLKTATDNTALPRIIFASESTDSSSPFYYHKTTLRDLYAHERQKALDCGALDVIFTNERGEVTEGSISNILIRQGNHFFTPPTESGLLPGVCREHLLLSHPGRISEKVLFPDDLHNAQAIYLVNSVRGVVQVQLMAPTSPD